MTDCKCSYCGDKNFRRMNPDIYDWCISLKNVGLPPLGHVSIDFHIEPPLEEDLYFCGLGCLKKWIIGCTYGD